MMASIQPQAFGLAIDGGHSVTLDAASPLDASASSSLVMAQPHNPVDLTFLGHIPANTPVRDSGERPVSRL